MVKTYKITLLLLSFLSLNITGRAQDNNDHLTRILFIFDASNSMYGQIDGSSKIKLAQEILGQTLDSLEGIENLELALRVYGHTKDIRKGPQDCNDTHLEVPFGENNAAAIKHRIKTIQPKGTTPIARSLEFADQDFPDCPECRNVIILITDGIEACDGDPCAISRALQARGVILKPFVVGIGTASYSDEFRCIGDYYDASDAETFKKVMKIVVSEAINSTSAQVNLLDVDGKPTETDVAFTLYDQNTGAIKYNYVHTMNREGNPDTLTIDPITTYRLVVHTIPQVIKYDIKLEPGIHNIIEAETPQGLLKLNQNGVNNATVLSNLKCIVREDGEMETLYAQDFSETERYIVGTYDLEILTLPRFYVEDVQISQSETTSITLPQPGLVTFQTRNAQQKGNGSIYKMDGSEMIWVCNLDSNNPNDKLQLLPGNYKVVYRNNTAKKAIYTIEKNFTVTSGKSEVIKLY